MICNAGKVALALISHDDAQRNAYVRPQITALAQRLSAGFTVDVLDIAWQPDTASHGKAMVLWRSAMRWHLERAWRRYRGLRAGSFMLDLARLVRGSIGEFLSSGAFQARRSAIQVATTSKHLRAWESFVDSGADALVCLENDVVFTPDSASGVAALLARILERAPGNLYVDLAGGLDRESLAIDDLLLGADTSFREYRRPVTNTTCGYLLTLPLARHLLSILGDQPWLRLLESDWLLNALFMRMARQDVSCSCLHADPPIFMHGSFAGTYPSWQAPPQ